MSGGNTSNDANSSSSDSSDTFMPPMVRFWILLPPNVASTLCALAVLFNVFMKKKSRTNIKNHVLIVLLVFGLATQLIDIPLYLNLMLRSHVSPANPFTCLLWLYVDIGLYNGAILLMTWMAFERHIIVFHDRWLSTTKRSIIVHYIPLSAIVLYSLLFYAYAFFMYPCEYEYDYTTLLCSVSPCFYSNVFLDNWDTYVNNLVPSLLEPIFTLAFLFRVVWQKYRSHQRVEWRKQRKMTIQLLSLSLPNIAINVPLSIFYIAYLCGLPTDVGADVVTYLFFFCYYITYIFPFTCMASIFDLRRIFRRQITDQPMTLTRFTATVRPQVTRKKVTTQV